MENVTLAEVINIQVMVESQAIEIYSIVANAIRFFIKRYIKMTNKYLIEGFEWFDKINGNSYHKANITDIKTNKLIYSSGLCYGYDNQYEQTAYDGLIELGLVKKEDRYNHAKNKRRFIYRKTENCLKRDLKQDEVTE